MVVAGCPQQQSLNFLERLDEAMSVVVQNANVLAALLYMFLKLMSLILVK